MGTVADLVNLVITVLGVFLAVAIAFGLFEVRRWRQIRADLQSRVTAAEKAAQGVQDRLTAVEQDAQLVKEHAQKNQ